MIKEQQIMADLVKVGFPQKDWASVIKIARMRAQLVELGLPEDVAYQMLLKSFSVKKEDSARRQKMIDIFRQSSLNSAESGNYFDIKGKISYLEKTLKHFGFDKNAFLQAVQKKPLLLNIAPEKFESNIVKMDELYAKDGLNGSQFLKIVLSHPDLAQYDFETLNGKIQTLMDDFSNYGIQTADLMTAIRKQPNILAVKPEEVIYKAHLLMHHHKRGLWQVGNGKPENPENALRAILTTRPIGLNLNVKNLRMRRLYAMFKPDETLALGTYLRTKKELQPMLENALAAKGRHSLLNRLYQQEYFERSREG